MARATLRRTSDAPRDAIALLKQDHRMVESLFDEFAKADEDEQAAIAERVCQLLTVHTQIEEEIFYPAARDALHDDGKDVESIGEAEVEHGSLRELITKIENMTSDDELFKPTVTVLGTYVKQHVKEEETEIFPAVKRTELDLKEMGTELADRKFALMEEMGIEEEEAPMARRRSAGSRATRAGASRARHARTGNRSRSSRGARSARH
jgi:hemerythrin superfamily protein